MRRHRSVGRARSVCRSDGRPVRPAIIYENVQESPGRRKGLREGWTERKKYGGKKKNKRTKSVHRYTFYYTYPVRIVRSFVNISQKKLSVVIHA